MEAFNKIVLGIAILLLIVILSYTGIIMAYYKKNTGSFPPNSATCPDYWTYDGTNCHAPTNGIMNKGNPMGLNPAPRTIPPPNGTMEQFNPTDSSWISGGKNAICSQRQWAIANNIEWDGVTNFTGC
jgi:hypothetical protein